MGKTTDRITIDGEEYMIQDSETKTAFDSVTELKSKNIINESELLKVNGWTENNGDFSGPINSINSFRIDTPYAETNTQYTLSLKAYNSSQGDTSSTGLVVGFGYTDNTETMRVYYPNSTSSFLEKIVSSDGNKTLKNIYFVKSSGTHNDTWHIKELQLEKGSTKTAFEKYELSATDDKAREIAQQTSTDFNSYIIIGKNICNAYDSDNVINNVYVNYQTHKISTLSDWCAIQFPVTGGAKISQNINGAHISFYTNKNDFTNMSVGDTLDGYIDGTSGKLTGYTVPATAKYCVISIGMPSKSTVQVEYGEECTAYEPYKKGINANDIVGLQTVQTITYNIKADGSGDFANLRLCLESITDSNKYKQYEVYIHEGTYDIGSLYAAELAQNPPITSAFGLYVPNYVTLIGVGRRDAIILKAALANYNSYFSVLHFRNYGGMKNLTIMGEKCRYTIHDDGFDPLAGGHRLVENCNIIGKDLDFGCVYGSGLRQDCHWEFINTIMDGKDAAKGGGSGLVFLSHNQTGWQKPSSITFTNCRLINLATESDASPQWTYSVRMRTIEERDNVSWNNMPVYVHFYGCECKGIALTLDNTSVDKVIAYYVDGYSNKDAWAYVDTEHTSPAVTVADRFNLIGTY